MAFKDSYHAFVRPLLYLGAGTAIGLNLSRHLEHPAVADLKSAATLIQREHLGETPSTDELYYAAIKGMVASVNDKHTHYETPEEAAADDAHDAPTFGGVGIEISARHDGTIRVQDVVEDSPAEMAGVLSRDIIVAVDGLPIAGKPLDESMELIRGEVGTDVRLGILRGEPPTPLDLTMLRAVVKNPLVKAEKITAEGQVYVHITIRQFQENVGALFREALSQAYELSADGIILDLRGNPGGLLNEAGEVICALTSDGPFAYTKTKESIQPHRCTRQALATTPPPIAILLNDGSASASEVTTGALQDAYGAFVIGEKSYGKGVGQASFELRNGARLAVTAFEWLTPKQRSVNLVGITPDLPIDRTPEDHDAGKDPQLDAAVQHLFKRPRP